MSPSDDFHVCHFKTDTSPKVYVAQAHKEADQANHTYRISLSPRHPRRPGCIAYRKTVEDNSCMKKQTPTTKQAQAAKELRVNERKWSKTLMDAGWTAVPTVIIERQKALGLDPTDVNIILHLASYWWTSDNKPHPSKKTIAEALGVTPRTVQRRIAAMEEAGFIRREQRRIPGKGSRTNLYHLDGLIKEAKPFAEEKLKERMRREKDDKSRPGRKGRPHLKVVSSEDD